MKEKIFSSRNIDKSFILEIKDLKKFVEIKRNQ